MNVGPVYWGAHSGETLEKVMAVLVAQEHPLAMRRTPSSGDGGVDVLIDGDAGWHVRQVKGFVRRMDAGHKRQVEKSFADVLREPRLGRPIVRWSLTVPIDPTSGEQEWFEDLTAGAPFPCNWDGEIYWHRMAASHPHVIDYYLRDGRARVEDRSEALLSAARAPSGPVSALDVAGHLEMLRASLNRDDPHYRYEFLTSAAPPEPESLPPDTAQASSRSIEGGQFLTIFVIARHRYATEDAPIGGTLNIRVRDPERGIDITEAFDEFRTFGVAVELPEGALDVVMSGPSGLGGSYEGAGGRILPMLVRDAPARTRLRVMHPDEGNVAELGLKTGPVTGGTLGGAEVSTTDDGGVLSVRFRLYPPDEQGASKVTFVATLNDITGRPVQEVAPIVRLLAQFTPPHNLQWLEEYGSGVLATYPFVDDVALLPEGLLWFVDNLAVVQDHVRGTVVVPQDIDEDAVRGVAEVAHLLRGGELRGAWTDMEMHLNEDVAPDDLMSAISGPGALVVERSWALELEGRTYDLGTMYQVVASVRPADEQPESGTSVRLVPGDDNTVIQRLGSLPTEPAEH